MTLAIRWHLAGLVTVATGFALRLWRLDAQSFWADEGATAVMAGRDPVAIWQQAALDIHPPLFYWLEAWWATLAGFSEYALRFPALAAGTATIAVTAAIGTRLLGRASGLAAAVVAATSPFLIQYSQEARMYAQLALLSVLCVYLALRLLAFPPEPRPWPPGPAAWALAAAALATAMTQYYAAATFIIRRRSPLGWPQLGTVAGGAPSWCWLASVRRRSAICPGC